MITNGLFHIAVKTNDLEATKDFYSKVAGWKPEPVSMGEYNDFTMFPANGENPVGGICHKKGENKMKTRYIIFYRASTACCFIDLFILLSRNVAESRFCPG